MSANEFDGSLATIWETIAEVLPDALAQAQGERRFTWAEFDRRANGIARTLLDPAASSDDRVALYLRNSPEYMEVQHAALKIGIPAVNTNYRYRNEELKYLFEDADISSVVFGGTFTETVAELRDQLPLVRHYLHVDDGTHTCPPWAIPYEQAAASESAATRSPWGRSGDDLYLMYTGGTTGLPKGVMWRVIDMVRQINDVTGNRYDLDDLDASIRATLTEPGPTHISGSPMMHGTGWFGATMAMHQGGGVISLVSPNLDAVELLNTIDAYGVSSVTIAGEVFARRVVAAAEEDRANRGPSPVRSVLSSGGILSEASKEALLELWPEASILDGFSSSEGFGMGWSMATRGSIPPTGRFMPGANIRILDESGAPVEAGSVGKLVIVGRLPQGYYKDPAKSDRTFPLIDGERTSIPGDNAMLLEDGAIQLMGRDSLCIISGGEKIFTEEVEAVILDHPEIADVLVFGRDDAEWGQAVCAVVGREPGATVEAGAVIAHVKQRLAGYKAPKAVVFVDVIPRGPNGKADYPTAKALFETEIARAAS